MHRESEGGRASTVGRDSKRESKHESSQSGQAKNPPGNEQDVRHIHIERPQPVQTT